MAALFACSAWAGDDPKLRSGWSVVQGGGDLLEQWSCLPSATVSAGKLAIAAGANYNTVVDTSGPRLRVQGDFSVLGTISAKTGAGAFLTLEGALGGQGMVPWWSGLKRLDAGIVGSNLAVAAWTGSSPDPVITTLFPQSAIDVPLNLEIARIGAEFVFFAGGAEIGRIDDPGLFSGAVYLGVNVAPGDEISVYALAAAAPSENVSNIAVVSAFLQTIARNGSGLRDAAEARGVSIGAAVGPASLQSDAYAGTLGREFNLMVAENVMKFATIHPAPNRYNFCPADQLLAFTSANGMSMRGHTLVWHEQLPRWLTEGTYSRDELIGILHDHIDTVVSHFKGKLIAWDVVNEAFDYSAPYARRDSLWQRGVGSDYVDMAFRWAREADPDVKLYYNETGGEGLGVKSDLVFNLVKSLRDSGAPIDGVGLQMHLNLDAPVRSSDVSANMRRLAQLGLSVQITEMDVRIRQPATAEKLAAQAAVYRDVFNACLSNQNCGAFLTWGVSDAASWIPGAYPGYGSALLFDDKFQPKPAYQAMLESLTGQ